MGKTNPGQETKRILLFLVITFALTYGYCFGVVHPLANGSDLLGVPALVLQLAVAAMMFFPAIGVLLTRVITGEGLRGSWLRPNLRGNIKVYLAAWFAPGILSMLGAAVYFLLFPGKLDLSLGYLQETLTAQGALEELPLSPGLFLVIQAVQGLLLAPILNFVTCFGEEWGWRGYLLPKMSEKFSALPTLLITGVIWGLWHAPITALGHNYGTGYPGFPWTGIAAMCGFCIVLGVFFSWLTLRTKSCIPAILAHGAVNGTAALGIYLTGDGGDPFVGPAPTGIVGVIPFLVVALLCLRSLLKKPRTNRI